MRTDSAGKTIVIKNVPSIPLVNENVYFTRNLQIIAPDGSVVLDPMDRPLWSYHRQADVSYIAIWNLKDDDERYNQNGVYTFKVNESDTLYIHQKRTPLLYTDELKFGLKNHKLVLVS